MKDNDTINVVAKEKQRKNIFMNLANRLFKYNGRNIRLWVLLAMVPIAIIICIYLYANYNFDSSIINENDNEVSETSNVENFEITEDKKDYTTQIQQKMNLPKTHTMSSNATTKEDKRLLDANGNMITVELQNGQTLENLAKEKLGCSAFWIYFFQVNRDKLNTPDDVKPGMKLYVPNPQYYGFSSKDNSSIQYAKNMAAQMADNQQ